MKTRYLATVAGSTEMAMIAILALCMPCFFATDVHADAQPNNSTVHYVPLQGSKLQVTLAQGHSASLPVKLSLPAGYKIINLLVLLSPWPDGIYGTVSPQTIQNAYAANTTLQIFVQPYVKPGNYTMDIVAEGWVNDTLGKSFMVNSEPPTKLAIQVLPYNGKISLVLGNMTDMEREAHCYHNGCSGFTSIEKYPLLIQSKYNMTVSLGGPDVPQEKWVHFDPVTVSTGPGGAQSIMTIAGMVQSLTGNNPISTRIFTIRAESQDGSSAQAYFPYEDNFNVAVLHKAGPINFTREFVTSATEDNFGLYGIVYDPGYNSSIPVKLHVAGLEQNDKILPLPQSVNVTIANQSFVLNATKIYYVLVTVDTSSAQAGVWDIAVNETVGGRQFPSVLPLRIMEPVCMGGPGMCGQVPVAENRTSLAIHNGEGTNVAGKTMPPPVTENTESPLKQYRSGVTTNNIKCREGFVVAVKKHGHGPACVSPDTFPKLVLWGWSENPLDGLLLRYGNQTQADHVFYDVMGEQKIRDWSAKGWRYSDYGYGTGGKAGMSATIFLYLPSGTGVHPECENGSYGLVVVSLRPVAIEHNYTEAGCEIVTTTRDDPASN